MMIRQTAMVLLAALLAAGAALGIAAYRALHRGVIVYARHR